MSNPLATYLHDHLAGAESAIDLLETLRDKHEGDDIGRLAAKVVQQVEEDRGVLERIADQVGSGPSTLKQAGAWLGEKASRAKLRNISGEGLTTFMVLETLSLGILGKLALWKALARLSALDPRLYGVDFDRLITRAEKQHAMVEDRRLEEVHTVFRRDDASG